LGAKCAVGSAGAEVQEGGANHAPSTTDFLYSGPSVLPFDHQDIKVYIDNLFTEGKLSAIYVAEVDVEPGSWVRCGIIEANADDDEVRISRLFELVEKDLPSAESRYSDWIVYAQLWAELSALVHCGFNEVRQCCTMCHDAWLGMWKLRWTVALP
jgi:hypothetical protein